jgi:hypothetical protein
MHAGFAVLAVMLVASGCRSLTNNCSKPGAYDTAEEVPSLKVPLGLDGPDTRQAMSIPALKEPEAPLPEGSRCLEEPPAFVGPHTVTAPAAAPAAGERGKGKRPGSRAPRS